MSIQNALLDWADAYEHEFSRDFLYEQVIRLAKHNSITPEHIGKIKFEFLTKYDNIEFVDELDIILEIFFGENNEAISD